MTKDHKLSDRAREFLAAVIKLYIQTGEAIGSKTLAQKSRESLSSATIRNILAELEAEGYLTHPHTSAGRLPTDKGYRFYVDHILSTRAKPSKSDQEVIHRYLESNEPLTTDELMARTSHALSEVSNNVGFVLTPVLGRDALKHIKFIRLTDHRILVLLVPTSGLLQERLIRVEEDLSQLDLDQAAAFVNENFTGKSLLEIRADLLALMTEEKALYDRLLQNVILLCHKGLSAGSEDKAQVYVDGASNILARPDFNDAERMQDLFRMFEEKSRLVKILNECLNAEQIISVRIGSENTLAPMQACSIVASRYRFSSEVVGGIGIVGPTRMEYARVITLVDYVARLFEQTVKLEN